MKRDYIKKVFTNLKKLKYNGIWLSGIQNEGEYKLWYFDGQLCIRSFYKNNKLEGEYKTWARDGKLDVHVLYKNGEAIKDYLKESELI